MNKWIVFIIIVVLVAVGDIFRNKFSEKGHPTPPPSSSTEVPSGSQVQIAKHEELPSGPRIKKIESTSPKKEIEHVQEPTAQMPTGERVDLSTNLEAKTFSLEEYKKLHPKLKSDAGFDKIPKDAIMIEANSKFPNEKTVPFSKLTVDCPDLKSLTFPVTLRVDGNGNITDVAPLIPTVSQSDIPAGIRNCQIADGGNEPYITTYAPTAPPKNP